MRSAKSNALFLRSTNWNRICPCVALVIRATLGECRSLHRLERRFLQVLNFRARAYMRRAQTECPPRCPGEAFDEIGDRCSFEPCADKFQN